MSEQEAILSVYNQIINQGKTIDVSDVETMSQNFENMKQVIEQDADDDELLKDAYENLYKFK